MRLAIVQKFPQRPAVPVSKIRLFSDDCVYKDFVRNGDQSAIYGVRVQNTLKKVFPDAFF